MLCFARANDIHFGLLDYRLHEDIFESYNYKFSYQDRTIPYYMIVKDGIVHHLEQKIWETKNLAKELVMINSGEERFGYSEVVKGPRNAINIFWEYTKKEIGKEVVPHI